MKSNSQWIVILLLVSKASTCSQNRLWKDTHGLSCYNYDNRYCDGTTFKK